MPELRFRFQGNLRERRGVRAPGVGDEHSLPVVREIVAAVTERLVLSISEAAELLDLSDDLVYHLVARGELPCLRFGRRKVIPRVAVEKVIELAMDHFDPAFVVHRLRSASDDSES